MTDDVAPSGAAPSARTDTLWWLLLVNSVVTSVVLGVLAVVNLNEGRHGWVVFNLVSVVGAYILALVAWLIIIDKRHKRALAARAEGARE